MVERHKSLVRAFFNTYYDDLASSIIEAVKREAEVVKVSRSKLVPELYFLELKPKAGESLDELAEKIEKLLKSDDRVFGVKVYVVRT